ncbi:hypothetical protein E4U43_001802 [Claviceps pusilla]|uniref:Uncharacterized protein n=1 Tax=Claviceps pusilla TaxID=123648 RepID=A0A9P7N748_9HYPO|nr:hypothetical protein E4U43_001802 [Claviceps pusilla]
MAILGRVTLNDGGFRPPYESLNDHIQLPQFLPRTKWPSEHTATELQSARIVTPIPIPHGNGSDAVTSEQLRQELYDGYAGTYRHLPPMPPFDNNDRVYFDMPWHVHLAIVHNLFHRTIKSSQSSGLTTQEMSALVRIVSYGMFNSMALFEPYHVRGLPVKTPPRTRPNTFEEMWNERFDMPTKLGRFSDGKEIRGTEDCKVKLWTRRYVVVPVLYGAAASQWGMTVFDRAEGHLYIFDCGDAEFRDERVKSCVHFWIEFWNALGMANTFYYFVRDTTPQPDVRESGYLSIIWLMNTLRNQVGHVMSTEDESVHRIDVDVCEPDIQMPFKSGLYLRDWVPDGCGTTRAAIMGVRRIVRIMLCNELGLKNHPIMTKQYVNPADASDPFPSAWTILSVLTREIVHNNGWLRSSRFWTALGGPQFALPMRTAIKPYNRHHPRRIRPALDEEDHFVEVREHNLSGRGWDAPSWPQGIVYTPTNPITRPLPMVQLRATGLTTTQSDGASSSFRLDLVNTLARQGYEDLEDSVDISLDPRRDAGLQDHQAAEEDGVLHYTMSIRVGEDEPVRAHFALSVGGAQAGERAAT